MTHAELKQAISDAAHAQGWVVFSQSQSRQVRPVKDSIGYPDLTMARDGEVLWVECKVGKDSMSPAQWGWWRALAPRCHVITPEQWPVEVAELLA